jgi:hypothetical protein
MIKIFLLVAQSFLTSLSTHGNLDGPLVYLARAAGGPSFAAVSAAGVSMA